MITWALALGVIVLLGVVTFAGWRQGIKLGKALMQRDQAKAEASNATNKAAPASIKEAGAILDRHAGPARGLDRLRSEDHDSKPVP